MKIIIWTTSSPKVKAIEEWIKKCVYFNWEEVEIVTIKVDSWIDDMPRSTEENMLGAKNRAQNCKKEIKWDYYIWMEWGTSFIWEKAYLFWVVYIENNAWEWHYWFSNMMEVPNICVKWIYEDREELWIVIDKLTWVKKEHQEEGSFWIWSDGMLNRKDQFLLWFLWAIAPFYNEFYKK